ncbi:MAG: hypothetical protein Hals2KO_16150 [Halioglobus sp.]
MSQKRGPYNSPRQMQRRRNILAAAHTEMRDHGLTSVTMKNIAERSGVSTKTLYNLFGSRDLLLLDAASVLLDDLEASDAVQCAKQGIPRLLAYTEAAMRGFEYGEFARYIISILFAAEPDHPAVHAQLGRIQRIAYHALCAAEREGELKPGLDLDRLSHVIAANQWGVALMWEKGLIDRHGLELQTMTSHYLTLLSVCTGKRRRSLQDQLNQYLEPDVAAGQPQPLEQK